MRKTTRLPKTVNGFLWHGGQSIKTQEGNVEAAMKLRSTNKRKLKKKLDPKGESPSAVQLERKLVAMWSSFNRNAPGGTAKLSL
jgi:hypothetical protein